MCGRYVLRNPVEALRALFDLPPPAGGETPRWNIAPTQKVLAVRPSGHGSGREAVLLSWGLVPRWAKDRTIAARLINARAESAAEKPAFRDAFRTRRCLVPADGFYEWGTAPTPRGRKPAWLFGLEGGEPFAFAALWESWREPGSAAPLESVALLTTAANDLVGRIHDRMPVIVPPADFDRWLAPPTGEGAVPDSLLAPFPSARMTAVAVGPRVGDARNDDAGCVEPVPVT